MSAVVFALNETEKSDSGQHDQEGHDQHQQELAWATVICYCVLIALTVSGNLLVILGFCKDATLQAITNYWIVSLSLTDIFLAASVLPLQLARELNRGVWAYGEVWCDVFTCLDVLCCTCSIYHLALISLDRYLCIRLPIAYPSLRTSQRTITAILLTWLFCTLLAMPRLLGWKDRFLRNECEIRNKSYTLFSSLVSFYIPLFLIMCMYVGIYRATRARTNRFRREMLTSQRMAAFSRQQKKKNRADSVPAIPLAARLIKSSNHHHHQQQTPISSLSPTRQNFQSSSTLVKRYIDPDLETIPEGTMTGYGNNSDESRSTLGGGMKKQEQEELMEEQQKTGRGTPASSLRKRIHLLENVREMGKRLLIKQPALLNRSRTAEDCYWRPSSTAVTKARNDRRFSSPFGPYHSLSILHSDPNLSATVSQLSPPLPNGGDAEVASSSLTQISMLKMTTSTSDGDRLMGNAKQSISQTASDVQRRRRKMTQAKLKRRRQKQENRTARVVLIVLGAFVIFWAPFFILNVILPWCASDCLGRNTQTLVWKWAVFWGYVNSAVNPFIYTFFNRTFRRAIHSVVKCQSRRRH